MNLVTANHSLSWNVNSDYWALLVILSLYSPLLNHLPSHSLRSPSQYTLVSPPYILLPFPYCSHIITCRWGGGGWGEAKKLEEYYGWTFCPSNCAVGRRQYCHSHYIFLLITSLVLCQTWTLHTEYDPNNTYWCNTELQEEQVVSNAPLSALICSIWS